MAGKKRIIVSVTNDLFTDQRVRRICEFLVTQDYELLLVGRRLKTSKKMPKTAYKTKRFRLFFTKGALFYASYNLRLFFFLLFKKADVLLANDLDTLYANHWARKFKRKCRLIYDSHEYYTGVPELINRPKVQRFWERIEKITVPKVDEMYTVNESIAVLYRQKYQRDVKVVRNISDFERIKTLKTRSELGLPTAKKLVIIQGAGINIDRGAEEVVEAITKVENAVLIFVGNGDVLPLLKEKVKNEKLEDKVLFFGKRTYQELMNFTQLADVGISMDKDTNVNYRFSLPNKIFDYIHAGIPLLVSDLTEVRKIVEGHEVGLVCPTHNPTDIAHFLKLILFNDDLSKKFRLNALKSAQVLNWQTECNVLKTIF